MQTRFSDRVINWDGRVGKEEEGRRGIFGCLHSNHRCSLGFVPTVDMLPRVMKDY